MKAQRNNEQDQVDLAAMIERASIPPAAARTGSTDR